MHPLGRKAVGTLPMGASLRKGRFIGYRSGVIVKLLRMRRPTDRRMRMLKSSHINGLLSKYALERSVRGFSERATGAQTIIAPTARSPDCARLAQRGR